MPVKAIIVSLSGEDPSSLLVWKGTSLWEGEAGKVRGRSSREGLNSLKATLYSFMQLIKNKKNKKQQQKQSTAKHPAREK